MYCLLTSGVCNAHISVLLLCPVAPSVLLLTYVVHIGCCISSLHIVSGFMLWICSVITCSYIFMHSAYAVNSVISFSGVSGVSGASPFW